MIALSSAGSPVLPTSWVLVSGVGLTFAGQLGGNVTTVTASVSGIPYSSMNVHRESDGGDILTGGTP